MRSKIQAFLNKDFGTKQIAKAVLCGLILTVILSMLPFFASCNDISDNVIRLHVVANSDSEADQQLKLAVRDAVLLEAAKWYEDAESFEEANTGICTHLQAIERAAETVIAQYGAAYETEVKVTDMYFSTRDYASFSLPAGKYRTLRVSIGEAKGQNWWCMVYPALCVPAAMAGEESGGNDNDILAQMPDSESRIIENPQDYQVKFKVLEWYEELKKLFDK